MNVTPQLFAAMLVFSTAGGALHAQQSLTLEQLRAQRRALAFRDRGIICNNDGCDALYFPENRELTAANFLALRTTDLAGTEVGAIAYCTISSGFSFFTHDTKAGTVLTRQPRDYNIGHGRRNVTQDLIDQGADCLKLVVDYAHENNMEAFWSMRMNDTHDVSYRPDKPYLLYPPLKMDHPDWLVGEVARSTRHGRWSSVNYALPQIRDLAFQYVEEVCENYDVDGIELDFFRHMCYFPSVANGGTATDEEREMMTELIRRIRTMTETVGLRRGRPILVAIRVADSIGFNRDMGLDVERWLREQLADILVTSCYFRLNSWDVSVRLGHDNDVAVYPSLSDSRVRGDTRFSRRATETYRARAANAWLAGADGVHLFNYFNPKADLWSEAGSAESLVGLDKFYFVTVRDGNPTSWLANADQYLDRPMLTPGRPLQLDVDHPAQTVMRIAEDLEAAAAKGFSPVLTAHVRVTGLGGADRLGVRLNGQQLNDPEPVDDWLDFRIQPDWIRRGENQFAFTLAPVAPTEAVAPAWTTELDGSALPETPWTHDRPATNTVAEVQDGALLLADRGDQPGDYRYYRYPWAMGPSNEAVVETRIKALSGVNCLIFGNGHTGERVRMYPDHMRLHHHPEQRADVDLSSDFRTVRLEISGSDIRVFVDGVLTLDAQGCFSGSRSYRNEIAFGSASSTEFGEALWDDLRIRIDSAVVSDLVVSVRYERP